MEVFAAITGSVLGFILGLHIAASAGLHAAEHVFPAAVVCAFVVGAASLAVTKRLAASFSGWRLKALLLLSVLCCAAVITVFLRMIL